MDILPRSHIMESDGMKCNHFSKDINGLDSWEQHFVGGGPLRSPVREKTYRKGTKINAKKFKYHGQTHYDFDTEGASSQTIPNNCNSLHTLFNKSSSSLSSTSLSPNIDSHESESLLYSSKIKAIELLPSQGPKPEELHIYNLVSRSDSDMTTSSNISDLKSLEVWNE